MSHYCLQEDEYHWQFVDSKDMVSKFANEIQDVMMQVNSKRTPITKQPNNTGHSMNDVPKPSSSSKPSPISEKDSEFIETINAACDKKTKLTFHKEWLYFIDCGGQIQFQQLIQAFIPCASALMLVIDLTRDLTSQCSAIMQCEEKMLKVSEYLPTVEILLKRLSIMVTSSGLQQQLVEAKGHPAITVSPNKIQVLVIATHLGEYENQDKVMETIDKKEEKLRHIFKPIKDNLILYGGKILFKIDASSTAIENNLSKQLLAHDDRVIRERLSKNSFKVKIPLSWYAFELLLRQKSNESCGVLSKEYCEYIGETLGLTKPEVQSALKFFHFLNTILYYPDVSNLVFIKPESLIEIIRQLVVLVYEERQSIDEDRVTTGDTERIAKDGIISRSFFEESEKFVEVANSFPDLSSELLRIFKYLLISTELPEQNTFFMPALLPLTDPSKIIIKTNHCILYYFDKGVPLGLFCAMVVNLLLEKLDTKKVFCDRSVWRTDSDSTMYSNYITLKHYEMADRRVIFVESNDLYEIYFECEDDKVIGEKAIDHNLKETIDKRKFNVEPKKAIFRICTDGQSKHVVVKHASGQWRCTECSKDTKTTFTNKGTCIHLVSEITHFSS